MAIFLHAAKDLSQHFWGKLPYYNYREHSGLRSQGIDHLLEVEDGQEQLELLPKSSAPAAEDPNGLALRVFTLNAGLIAVTAFYKERMAGIISHLNSARYDVACLQEICFQWIAVEMIQKTKQNYPYSYFFNFGIGFPLWPGCDGTGLLLLSRFPILETFYDRYHVNGFPWALHHCDFLGSKGISFARIELPPQFSTGPQPAIMTLYATHLHAEYNDNYQARASGSQDEYHAHRVAQGLQMAQFARLTMENDPSHLHLMLGDFNAPPNSTILGLQALAGFKDVMEDEDIQHAEPRATFGCKSNFFHTHGKTLPQRVDFILYRTAATVEERAALPWRPVEARTVTANIPNSSVSLSDHYGVTATFAYDPSKSSSTITRRQQPDKSFRPVLESADDLLQHGIDLGLRRRNTHRNRALFMFIVGVCTLLSQYGQRQWAFALGLLCVFLCVVELVICHYVIKDEIKVFQEKSAQVHLFMDTIR